MPKKKSFDEVRKSVASAIERGTLLRIPLESRRIAKISGAPAESVAGQLTEAGIKAGINIEFGAPYERRDARDSRAI